MVLFLIIRTGGSSVFLIKKQKIILLPLKNKRIIILKEYCDLWSISFASCRNIKVNMCHKKKKKNSCIKPILSTNLNTRVIYCFLTHQFSHEYAFSPYYTEFVKTLFEFDVKYTCNYLEDFPTQILQLHYCKMLRVLTTRENCLDFLIH